MSKSSKFRVLPWDSRRSSWIGIAVGLVLIAVECGLVSTVYPPAGMAFLYFFGMTILLYGVLVGEEWREPILLFAFYSGLILLGYYLNYLTFPSFFGFTPAGIAGTDDSYFYSLVASSLPSDFPVREYYHLRDHPYEILMEGVTPFTIEHPFEILFFNAVGAVFTPLFSRSLAQVVTEDKRVARLTFWLVALCPFLISNSVVLIRDGWTATLFAGSLLFFLQRRFVLFVVFGFLLFFLRIASGLQLGLVAGILSLGLLERVETRKKQVAYVIGLAGLAAGTLMVIGPYLVRYAQYAGEGGIIGLLYRESFLEFLRRGGEESFMLTINTQPWYIRIPGAFAFYFSFPFVTTGFVVQGEVIWRGVLMNLYSLLFIVYIKYIVQGVGGAIRSGEKNIQLITFSLVLLVVILSQASMQLRHKTMILPLYYIIISYGYYEYGRIEYEVGWISMFLVAFLNISKFLFGF